MIQPYQTDVKSLVPVQKMDKMLGWFRCSQVGSFVWKRHAYAISAAVYPALQKHLRHVHWTPGGATHVPFHCHRRHPAAADRWSWQEILPQTQWDGPEQLSGERLTMCAVTCGWQCRFLGRTGCETQRGLHRKWQTCGRLRSHIGIRNNNSISEKFPKDGLWLVCLFWAVCSVHVDWAFAGAILWGKRGCEWKHWKVQKQKAGGWWVVILSATVNIAVGMAAPSLGKFGPVSFFQTLSGKNN